MMKNSKRVNNQVTPIPLFVKLIFSFGFSAVGALGLAVILSGNSFFLGLNLCALSAFLLMRFFKPDLSKVLNVSILAFLIGFAGYTLYA
jgi:hypothetical protein